MAGPRAASTRSVSSALPIPDPPADLPQALARAAALFPERGVAVFDSRARGAERRTYPEVLASAERGAARLAARGVAAGDPVVVCLPSSWEWFESWLGALLLGALPVAAAPSAAMGSAEGQVRRLEGLAERLGATLVVATPGFRTDAAKLGVRLLGRLVATPEELAATAAGAPPPRPESDPAGAAYLQLTSGSTGLQRAVMVTHRGALHNVVASDEAIGRPHGRPGREWVRSMVSWLPLYHDMGLVGCVLYSLVAGFDLWLLHARSFLARPQVWLEELGRHGPAIAPAPNFGYQLAVERTPAGALSGIDLAPFRAAMMGAEMIHPETAAAFCRAFAPRGFSAAAVRPCYGLAEATLAATFDCRGEGVRTRPMPAAGAAGGSGNALVCVGAPVLDTEVRVVAPDGSALGEERVGEVEIRGPGVFAGYFGDAAATAETLHQGWLRTGDLGFAAEGELYLTGRLKDILIVRGQNLMPHELEWLAESVTGGGGALRSGAISVERGVHGEEAVLVVETEDREPAALARLDHEVRLAVARALSLPLADLVFVRRGVIPKTTSGKVQRNELRHRYLAGEIERLA